MASKRTPIRRQQIGSEMEFEAWRDTFAAGFDFFESLEPFGVVDPTGKLMPADAKATARRAYHAAAREAWGRFGARFLAERDQTAGVPWALEQFGDPR